jgi:hypothetical protein
MRVIGRRERFLAVKPIEIIEGGETLRKQGAKKAA